MAESAEDTQRPVRPGASNRGTNQIGVRLYNERLVLSLIRRHRELPKADIARLKARMAWGPIPWYTITDDFDADFGVDEWHGTNAFIRDGDRVFRTYFVNVRGDEAMGSTWAYLDITALGRQEEWEDSPEGYPQTPPYDWWIWHDEPRDARPAAW